jgi:hypothetical protein
MMWHSCRQVQVNGMGITSVDPFASVAGEITQQNPVLSKILRRGPRQTESMIA